MKTFHNSTILVTGCAGFIGFHLCKKLLEEGENVVGIDNFSNLDPTLSQQRLIQLQVNSRFQFYNLDLTNFNELLALEKKHSFSEIFHLAAQTGVRSLHVSPQKYFSDNDVAFLNILELSRLIQQHNKKIPLYYASSSSVKESCSFYGLTKKINEDLADFYASKYKISITGLRFFTVYGPWGRPDMAVYKFSKLISEEKELLVFGNALQSRHFTYIDDVISTVAHLRKSHIACEQHSVFEISNSQKSTLSELIVCLEKNLRQKALKKFTSALSIEILHSEIDLTKQIYYSATRSTPYSLEEGIPLFLKWFRRQSRNEINGTCNL